MSCTVSIESSSNEGTASAEITPVIAVCRINLFVIPGWVSNQSSISRRAASITV